MEKKKHHKNNSSSNLEQFKPKLIKRDIQIIPNKKENIIPSVFNINIKKPVRRNSQKKFNSNSINISKKGNNKNKDIYSARENNNNRKKQQSKKQKKFKNIDEIVLFLQKNIRNYLYRIHNEPKLQMIKMLKEKKKNLFENYKIINNPTLINEFKKEQIEKNNNDINENNKIMEDNKEKIIDNKNENNNLESEKVIDEKKEEKNIRKYIPEKSNKLNEDLEGLKDTYDDISDIEEEIINNYIEEPKEIIPENIIVNNKKKKKKVNNNFKFEIVIDKKNNKSIWNK